jgi:uncharacterized protein (TIGR02147 family)
MSRPTPGKLLEQALKRAIRNSPSYSMRALARKIGVSAPYLSRMLKGEKPIPDSRFKSLVRVLEMDETAQRRLKIAMLREEVQGKREIAAFLEKLLTNGGKSAHSAVDGYTEGSLAEQSLLEPFFKVAMLDLVTCADFVADAKWIADRLGIRVEEAKLAFEQLAAAGLIAEQEGKWIKVELKLRFPATRSRSGIRRYHQNMMLKALEVLTTQTSDEEFLRRMIIGVSFAANPAHLPQARERLNEMLYELTEILTEGECTEIYQLNAQLFPLTKFRPRNR